MKKRCLALFMALTMFAGQISGSALTAFAEETGVQTEIEAAEAIPDASAESAEADSAETQAAPAEETAEPQEQEAVPAETAEAPTETMAEPQEQEAAPTEAVSANTEGAQASVEEQASADTEDVQAPAEEQAPTDTEDAQTPEMMDAQDAVLPEDAEPEAVLDEDEALVAEQQDTEDLPGTISLDTENGLITVDDMEEVGDPGLDDADPAEDPGWIDIIAADDGSSYLREDGWTWLYTEEDSVTLAPNLEMLPGDAEIQKVTWEIAWVDMENERKDLIDSGMAIDEENHTVTLSGDILKKMADETEGVEWYEDGRGWYPTDDSDPGSTQPSSFTSCWIFATVEYKSGEGDTQAIGGILSVGLRTPAYELQNRLFQMARGQYYDIAMQEGCHIQDAANLDNEWGDAEITAVASDNNKVIEVIKPDEEEEDPPFCRLYAVSPGSANVTLTYTVREGVTCQETFAITVNEEAYYIDFWSDTGSYTMVPGSTMTLNANTWKDFYNSEIENMDHVDDPEEATVDWTWEYCDESPESCAKISKEGSSLALTAVSEGHLRVKAEVLVDGTKYDEASQDVWINATNYRILMKEVVDGATSFEKISELLPGDEQTVTPVVYSYDSEHPEGTPVPDEVLAGYVYGMNWNPDTLEIKDNEGNLLGDENSGYTDDQPYTPGMSFTLKKISTGDSEVEFWLYYTGEPDEKYHPYIDEKLYFWINSRGYDTQIVPADKNKEERYHLYTENDLLMLYLNEDYLPEGYDVKWEVGSGYDEDGSFIPLEDVNLDKFTDGIAELNGKDFADRIDTDIVVKATVSRKGIVLVDGLEIWINIRRPVMDAWFNYYDWRRTDGQYMLMPYEPFGISSTGNLRVENGDYPEEEYFDLTVLDVSCKVKEGPELAVEVSRETDDEGNPFWSFNLRNPCVADVVVKYLNGYSKEEEQEEFTLVVAGERYDLWVSDANWRLQPGESLDLSARLDYRNTDEGQAPEDVTIKWSVDTDQSDADALLSSGAGEPGVTELTGENCTVTAGEQEGNVLLRVEAFVGEDMDNPVDTQERWINISNYKIFNGKELPDDFEQWLLEGDSITIRPVVMRGDEEIEIVRCRYEVDNEDVIHIDENDDGSYTITKSTSDDTSFRFYATVMNDNGDEEPEISSEWHFHAFDLNDTWLNGVRDWDNRKTWVFSDEENNEIRVEVPEGFDESGCSLEADLKPKDDDDGITTELPEGAFSFDKESRTITLNGAKLKEWCNQVYTDSGEIQDDALTLTVSCVRDDAEKHSVEVFVTVKDPSVYFEETSKYDYTLLPNENDGFGFGDMVGYLSNAVYPHGERAISYRITGIEPDNSEQNVVFSEVYDDGSCFIKPLNPGDTTLTIWMETDEEEFEGTAYKTQSFDIHVTVTDETETLVEYWMEIEPNPGTYEMLPGESRDLQIRIIRSDRSIDNKGNVVTTETVLGQNSYELKFSFDYGAECFEELPKSGRLTAKEYGSAYLNVTAVIAVDDGDDIILEDGRDFWVSDHYYELQAEEQYNAAENGTITIVPKMILHGPNGEEEVEAEYFCEERGSMRGLEIDDVTVKNPSGYVNFGRVHIRAEIEQDRYGDPVERETDTFVTFCSHKGDKSESQRSAGTKHEEPA